MKVNVVTAVTSSTVAHVPDSWVERYLKFSLEGWKQVVGEIEQDYEARKQEHAALEGDLKIILKINLLKEVSICDWSFEDDEVAEHLQPIVREIQKREQLHLKRMKAAGVEEHCSV